MKILLCNDDGYQAPGIRALHAALAAAPGVQVEVVAPERNNSAKSNALTLHAPLFVHEAANGFRYVSGTPADCVHLALTGLLGYRPDLVVSGINNGANMGDDTLYSGTVAAATEAYLMGIPAIAFSLAGHHISTFTPTVEKAVWSVLTHVLRQPKPETPVLWNVNIPTVAAKDLRGIRITRLGRRHHEQNMLAASDPRGEPIYWIGPAGGVYDSEEGTDFAACESGFVSITPLQVDLTAHAQIDALRESSRSWTLHECP